MKLFNKCCVVLLAGLLVSACSEGEGPAAPAEPTVVQGFMADPTALERGEALFVGTCAGYCHGTTRGDTDALFLFDCACSFSLQS